jgi:hypothetical protein
MAKRFACAVSAVVAGVIVLAGCVPIPEDQRSKFAEGPASSSTTPGVILPLDAGAIEVASQHFVTKGYGADRTKQISELAEHLYDRIMTDTGLYTFQPPKLYTIVVYAGKDEFVKKTQQPDWSDGISAGGPGILYVYDGPQLGPSLAHYMSHLIFYQYMASPRQDYRWLDEGLAVYEELQEMTVEGLRSSWRTQWQTAFRTRAMPFDQMTTLVPATERDRINDLWYQQVGDVVRYIIEQGGRNGVSTFLGTIRDGGTTDNAIRLGFPGIWNKFSDVEAAWKLSLG